MTAKIINMAERRQGKSNKLKSTIEWILSQDQSIVIGTFFIDKRLEELRCWFPDAKLEVVEMGIKISNG